MPELHDQQRERAYKAALKKSIVQNQRALRIGEERGTFTADEWLSLCERHENKCVLCGYPRPLTPDHVIPLMLGGSNFIQNIQPLCHPCNIVKRGISMDYRFYETSQSDNSGGSTPTENSTEQAPIPIWRAELLSIEQSLGCRQEPNFDQTKFEEQRERGGNPALVLTLVTELRRLRNLILDNETLAHIESVTWWSSGILPGALYEYLSR